MTKRRARQRIIITQANKNQRGKYKRDVSLSSGNSTPTENNPPAIPNTENQSDHEPLYTKVGSLSVPVGLSNLGNTCFFNSIMQNFIQTPLLHAVLKHELKVAGTKRTLIVDDHDIPPLVYAPTALGQISLALISFFDAVLTTQNTLNSVTTKRVRNKTVSPKSLFNEICLRNARFRGYQQQDSQELYHCLLDSIKTEEIKRRKQGILRALNLEKMKAKDVPEDVRKNVKVYGVQVALKEETITEKIFGGKLTSSVLCDGCGTVTGVTESFLDLSLPIVEEKRKDPHHHKISVSKSTDSGNENTIEVESLTNRKNPLSKHAIKKARKQARRQSRQSFGKRLAVSAHQEDETQQSESLIQVTSENGSEPLMQEACEKESKMVENLAESLVENTLSLALSSLKLSTLNDTDSIANGCSMDVKFSTKIKGGAQNVEELNLPAEETCSDAMKDGTVDQHSSNENGKSDLENGTDSPVSDHDRTSDKETSDDNTLPLKKETFPSLFDTPLRCQVPYTFSDLYCKLPESLSTRRQPSNQECSLHSCLYQFTMPEMLMGANKFGCETCTKKQCPAGSSEKKKLVYSSASKQMLISKPPLILTIHLKRFHQTGFNLHKVIKHVTIPTTLDISPFCTVQCQEYANKDLRICYDLYGIVEHSGSLTRGHYTAYVKVRPCNESLIEAVLTEQFDYSASIEEKDTKKPAEWYHISDANVSRTTEAKALSSNAYLLFYERII